MSEIGKFQQTNLDAPFLVKKNNTKSPYLKYGKVAQPNLDGGGLVFSSIVSTTYLWKVLEWLISGIA